ncbi:MAG: mercuric transporter MerT family protein [Gemmatimonadota bacterium]|nr:mercuric transporter MerT family protein [Gemmatimonadota bacterium]
MTSMSSGSRDYRGRDVGAIAASSTGIGAAVVTFVAGTCCLSPVLAPIIVGLIGASGAAWAAGLEPYSPWILGASFLALVWGFWSVYRPRRECSVDSSHQRLARLPRVAKGILWAGAFCWALSLVLFLILPKP